MVSALAVSFPVCLLFWSSLVHGAAVSGGPSFMMISGISASEEMCLTAADGRNHGADLRWLCQATASMQAVLMLMGLMWFWNPVQLPSRQAMAASFGSLSRRPPRGPVAFNVHT